MLSRQQHTKSTNNYHFFNCALLRSPPFHCQEGNILISDPRQLPSSQSSHPNPLFFRQRGNANKPKTSLRGSRVIKGKQNTTGQVTPEESPHIPILNSQLERTIAKSRWDSTPFDQNINLDEGHRKNLGFFKTYVPQIEKTVDFRRQVDEKCKQESEQTKRHIPFNQHEKLEPSIQIECTYRTMQYSKDCRITEPIQRSCQTNIQQTNFATEENISSQKNTQYYSHRCLQPQKQSLMQQYSQQVSTLVLKKKTTRVLHYIQRMQFKSTQSIDQAESVQVSEVISDISSLSSNQNQSEQDAPRPKRLSQFLKPKYSRIGLNAPI